MATKVKVKAGSVVVAKANLSLPAEQRAVTAAELAGYRERLGTPSGNRILVTQSKTFKFPNGDDAEEFEGVIVDFCAMNIYYATKFDRNNIVPPTCIALGLDPSTLKPDAKSPEVQSKDCATCWANQWESSAEGGRGKACSNARMLAILPPDTDAATPILTLRISPTAIKAFDAHVGMVARTLDIPIRGVVTKFGFSGESEYATIRFTVARPVDGSLWNQVHARKVEAQALILTVPDLTASNKEARKDAAKPASKRPAKK